MEQEDHNRVLFGIKCTFFRYPKSVRITACLKDGAVLYKPVSRLDYTKYYLHRKLHVK